MFCLQLQFVFYFVADSLCVSLSVCSTMWTARSVCTHYMSSTSIYTAMSSNYCTKWAKTLDASSFCVFTQTHFRPCVLLCWFEPLSDHQDDLKQAVNKLGFITGSAMTQGPATPPECPALKGRLCCWHKKDSIQTPGSGKGFWFRLALGWMYV